METNEAKIAELLASMTIEEKVSMCHSVSLFESGGVKRMGLPTLKMTDGPHGVREEVTKGFRPAGRMDDAATYFSSGIALAATWNPVLAEKFGEAIAEEARARGKDVILAPGINVIRTPLCGRNFEYLSEDPYLISRIAVSFIKGVQGKGVAACVKHYALNNQEYNREKIDVDADDRALHEIYLPGFKAAVQEAGVWAVMAAYNKFRGEHCSQNGYLLKKTLKNAWGFKGVVISDWGATHDTVKSAENGLDIEMGSRKYFSRPLLKAVRKGKIPESILDDMVARNLRLRQGIGMFDENRPSGSINSANHQMVSRKIAEESIILLKNSRSILPLKAQNLNSIAIIGDNAEMLHAYGGGSSEVKALYEVSPLEGIKSYINSHECKGSLKIKYARGYSGNSGAAEKLRQEAVDVACNSDVVVIFAGLNHDFDREGKDRESMTLPYGQDELIEEVCKANRRSVVVLVGGSPVDMRRWSFAVQGIIQMFYAGMESGNAIADVIFGDVNPSGKLPVTFPKSLEDSPAHFFKSYPGKNSVTYTESIMVGYRYFDTYNVKPKYCFGHGLSYTKFAYKDLKVSYNKNAGAVNVNFSLFNIGDVPGAEVVQIYVADIRSRLPRPVQELKFFKKIKLPPGESTSVSVQLGEDAFKYYDPGKDDWVLEPGDFLILVGSSSRDIRLTGIVSL